MLWKNNCCFVHFYQLFFAQGTLIIKHIQKVCSRHTTTTKKKNRLYIFCGKSFVRVIWISIFFCCVFYFSGLKYNTKMCFSFAMSNVNNKKNMNCRQSIYTIHVFYVSSCFSMLWYFYGITCDRNELILVYFFYYC